MAIDHAAITPSSEPLSLGNSSAAFIVRRIVILPTTKERKFQRVALSFARNYIDEFLARISPGVEREKKRTINQGHYLDETMRSPFASSRDVFSYLFPPNSVALDYAL